MATRIGSLTERQERFCKGIALGCNGHKAAEEAGYVGNIDQTAYRLLKLPHIAARIERLKKQQDLQFARVSANLQVCTLETHLTDLGRIRDLAMLDRKWQPACEAERLRGTVMGYYALKVADPETMAKAVNSQEVKSVLVQAMQRLQDHGMKLDELERADKAKTIPAERIKDKPATS